MSISIANPTISLPISSQRKCKLLFRKSPNSLRSPIGHGGNRGGSISVVARAADGRDSLDHLQRTAAKSQTQQQPKKRIAQSAPIGLWDRFPTARTVQQMMETMDRMMEDPVPYGYPAASSYPAETGGYSRGRTPWEIKEAEKDYKMRFDMPGMSKEDVKVWVEEKMLVVKGEKAPKKKVNGENGEEEEGEWPAKSYGKYSFRIALPENVQFEKIKAGVRDGVLYISIPKAEITSKVLDINVE
ncbi:hypothetical protein RHMOL_Rhmol12G0038000 [Rhododendron molle]|uniref:Uncharacterized protein n=1 Tax=Rhododendron molle TaxID=49168 RepID=A0ACC0LDY5_RHOML|nr:hypothetical protein RHMOL_Rhmol12G0038000 [Rhododendron molle]